MKQFMSITAVALMVIGITGCNSMKKDACCGEAACCAKECPADCTKPCCAKPAE
ncbi:hypothetical protein P4B35_00670 [Pontiellaceae bacterium B12227]|nr:hypothetical protein [Pontiellaceae bacterium B12227]